MRKVKFDNYEDALLWVIGVMTVGWASTTLILLALLFFTGL